MALSANTVWEVRASGASDNNGGGFVAGGATDYSQQNAAQASGTDLACTTPSVTVTSASALFTSAMVGNLMQITAGTNFTTGFYQIATFVNSTTITLDRTPCPTTTGSGGTWAIGGALATLGKLAGAMVGSNKAYVTGAFTSTATITFSQAGTTPQPTRVIGYGSARMDSGHATLTLQTNTGLIGINPNGTGFSLEQVDINCGSLGTSTGFSVTLSTSTFWQIRNCKVSNFTSSGITNVAGVGVVENCEVTGGTSAASAGILINQTRILITGCNVHDNACPGILFSTNGSSCEATFNLVTNNSGAASDGIAENAGAPNTFENNTVHGNGRDGIRITAAVADIVVLNNILTNNSGFGFNNGGAGVLASMDWDGNAYFGNTSGTRNNVDSTAGIYGINPYTNTRDVILTGSPYVGPTTGSTANFALNNTAGAGAAAKGVASPRTWPGNTGTTSFLSMGAVQPGAVGVSGGGFGTGSGPYIIAST